MKKEQNRFFEGLKLILPVLFLQNIYQKSYSYCISSNTTTSSFSNKSFSIKQKVIKLKLKEKNCRVLFMSSFQMLNIDHH